MQVSIIIINYNTFQLTADCIQSVMEYTRGITYEIILVDNHSTETSPGKFAEMFPSIKLVCSTVNGGFAQGNNLGIQHASGEFILLLNSDTFLRDDAITATYHFTKSQFNTGVTGCRMIFPDGGIQHTARRFRSIRWELFDLFRFIPYALPYDFRATLMLGKYFKHDVNKACDWLNGAFFMFPKKILQQLPGNKLDDRFFMYGEDHLWCAQIKKLGYQHVFFAGATIVHINSGSTAIKNQLGLKKIMMHHELEIMKWRKGTGMYYWVFAVIFKFKEISRAILKRIVFKTTGKLIR